jgi:hypothetical protein
MWIVFGPDSAARLTEGAGVLAPRADGFWRFDVVDDDRGLEMLVAEPASQPSRRDTVVRFGARVPTDPRNRSLTIEFVGPRHLGYIKEAFFPGENREYRERYAPDQRGVLGPDLSPVQTDAFLGAAAEVLAVEASGYEGCGGHPVWTVVRDAQRWVFAGFHNSVDTFGRGCDAADADISTYVEPSRDVIDYSPVFILLVRFVVPSAVDAVLSPNRDAVVALTPDSIYAFTVSPTAFGTPRAVAAESGRVVMAEWALGRHVARWTGEVRKWLTR